MSRGLFSSRSVDRFRVPIADNLLAASKGEFCGLFQTGRDFAIAPDAEASTLIGTRIDPSISIFVYSAILARFAALACPRSLFSRFIRAAPDARHCCLSPPRMVSSAAYQYAPCFYPIDMGTRLNASARNVSSANAELRRLPLSADNRR
jgi:hypothetical protein